MTEFTYKELEPPKKCEILFSIKISELCIIVLAFNLIKHFYFDKQLYSSLIENTSKINKILHIGSTKSF